MTKSNIPDELKDSEQLGASPLIEGLSLFKNVWIEGEYLVAYWGYDYFRSVNLNVKSAEAMLSEFLELGDASNERIKEYAKKWGFLGLCGVHSVPFNHAEECHWKQGPTEFTPNVRTTVYESLSGWRSFARQARAIMNLAKNLIYDEPGDSKEWDTLKEGDVLNKFSWWDMAKTFPVLRPDGKGLTLRRTKLQKAREQQSRLASVINIWLEMAGTIPHFSSWAGRTYLHLIPRKSLAPLFNALVLQMMFYIHGTSGFAFCANCSKLIGLRRGQILNRRVYCELCGKKAGNRDAAKRYRLRNREHPKREKRERSKLKPQQIKLFEQRIETAKKKDQPLRPLIIRFAIKYKVSESTLYKITKKKL